jgi:hypothetical protein
LNTGFLSRELEYADGHDTGAVAYEGIVVGQEAGTQTLLTKADIREITSIY